MSTTCLYEAGGNLFWCNTLPISEEASTIAGQAPSWSAVLEMEGLFELPTANAASTEEGGALLAKTCWTQCPVALDVSLEGRAPLLPSVSFFINSWNNTILSGELFGFISSPKQRLPGMLWDSPV